MSVSVSLDSSGATPKCMVSGVLDFDSAPQALDKVSVYIKDHRELDIDLSGVSSTNSAGLALLIEWLATGRRSGNVVTFHHIPNSLRQLAGVCQVDGLI